MSIEGTRAVGFSGKWSQADSQLVVDLTGNADVRAVTPLEKLFAEVHTVAQQKKAKRVRVDLRQLDFMNSSCFKTLVSWLARVQESSSPEQYSIVFISDGSKHWQKRSLTALICFAPELVKIEA